MKKVLNILVGLGTVAGVLTLTMASLSQAKVSDFNALINENISAQKELHGEVRKQMTVTQESLNPGTASSMVVESDQTQINTPTSQKMLRFKKESVSRSASQKKQMDRVSQEFDDASTSF